MSVLTAIYDFIAAHAVISTLVSYWVLSATVGALPSPGPQSSPLYVFFFKFFNSVAGNILRAISSKVESSPNFQGAVNLQQQMAGQRETTVKVPPTVEDKPKS